MLKSVNVIDILLITAVVILGLLLIWNILQKDLRKKKTQSNFVKDFDFNLDSVLANNNDLQILFAIDDHVNRLSNYGNDLTALTQEQANFLFVENLEREINNGGFRQFYWNSSGDYANETVKALLEIGALKTSFLVNKANQEFAKGEVPKEREERFKMLEAIEEKAESTWNELDKIFYKYEDPIGSLLIEYVRKNKNRFK
ncbi:DMP19 family protein [Flavobacteriaceae bacterium M23B6Z8]